MPSGPDRGWYFLPASPMKAMSWRRPPQEGQERRPTAKTFLRRSALGTRQVADALGGLSLGEAA